MTFKKSIPKATKKTLNDLINEKTVITGKEVIHNLKEHEKLQKEFEEAVEFERRNGRGKLSIHTIKTKFWKKAL